MVKINSRSIQTKVLRDMQSRIANGMSLQKAAENAHIVSTSTAKRWWSIWIDCRRLPCDVKIKYYRENVNVVWNQARDDELRNIINKCHVLYLDEIAEKLNRKFDHVFTVPSISLRLAHLKITRKVVYEKASQQIDYERQQFLYVLRQVLEREQIWLFLWMKVIKTEKQPEENMGAPL